jgi:hypothetical protein
MPGAGGAGARRGRAGWVARILWEHTKNRNKWIELEMPRCTFLPLGWRCILGCFIWVDSSLACEWCASSCTLIDLGEKWSKRTVRHTAAHHLGQLPTSRWPYSCLYLLPTFSTNLALFAVALLYKRIGYVDTSVSSCYSTVVVELAGTRLIRV